MDPSAAIKAVALLGTVLVVAVVMAVIRNMIRDAAITGVLKTGAKKRDKADKILSKPVAKGKDLVARLLARARKR